ncbi:MAG TPA: MATE family efflux transporter, partial [Tissierellaceae bacterium]
NHGLLLTMFISIFITFIFLLFNKQIVNLLGATPEIFDETREYFIYFTIFIPFFMLNYALGTWIRNDDKPNLAMIGQIIGAILNIILDYIFMAPLNMGIKGAAIATGLGPIIGIIILLPHFLTKKGDLYIEKVEIKASKLKDILIGGLPSFAIEFSLGLMTFFLNIFIAMRFKENGLAAFGVIGYINLIMLSIYLGIGQGTQPLISLYYGQKKYDDIHLIYSFCLKLSILLGILGYILLLPLKSTIIPIFIDSGNIEVIELTKKAINLFFITLSITGVNIITASIFEAKQNIIPSIIISFSRSFIFLVPSLLILNKFSNPNMLWLSVPISEILTLFISIYLWNYVVSIEEKNVSNKINTKHYLKNT